MNPSAADRVLISLTTDFGIEDAYLGVMKSVILTRAPRAEIIDLSHAVPPQSILDAAFLLETATPYFPTGSIHIVVVDPGVGSGRRRIVIESGGCFYVGPDNGCLSAVVPSSVRGNRRAGEDYVASLVPLPPRLPAVAIENRDIFLQPLSSTFEGRDAFAPAAAYLANGGALSALGPAIEEVRCYPTFAAPTDRGGIDGRVLHVDHYGNLITDIRSEALPITPVFRLGGSVIRGVTRTYSDAAGLAAIVGSSGFVEIALPNGNAAGALAVETGAVVTVESP
jgi:S-adenosylmethionine hydrolase